MHVILNVASVGLLTAANKRFAPRLAFLVALLVNTQLAGQVKLKLKTLHN